MAQEETGLGNWKDKVIKNVVATQLVYEDIKDKKTVGIIREDFIAGVTEIGHPLGPILGITSKKDPTASAIFKILISLKTRNPIILSPPKVAEKVCKRVVEVCYQAALSEDAPEDCIQFFYDTSTDEFDSLIADKRLALIIATGERHLKVKADNTNAPVIGAGTSNVPVYISKTADIEYAVEQIMKSKTFDNGIMGSSEQTIIADKANSSQIIRYFKKEKAYFLGDKEVKKLENYAINKFENTVNTEIMGKTPQFIADKAGFLIPKDIRLLIVPLSGVGNKDPLSTKILAPIIAYYVADDFNAAVNFCIDLNYYGGSGHTVSLFSNDENEIKLFSKHLDAGRILVNMPSSLGAVGGVYNSLSPSFTLACGTGGKTTTMDNVSVKHLMNIQRISRRRLNERTQNFNIDYYFDESKDADFIEKEYNLNY